jgi:hypothetical protein
MNRVKEIVYVLGLGFLFVLTVQLSLSISKKPSVHQRIPLFTDATFELSAQPVSLVKELLTTELFQVKNQVFLNQLRQFRSSNQSANQLDGIDIDMSQAMSFILLDAKAFSKVLIHFHAKQEAKQEAFRKHYVHIGFDVFYSPSTALSKTQARWILQQVRWKEQVILAKQMIVHQNVNGETSEGSIQWDKNELRYVTRPLKTNQTLILSPRFFHYSNQFANKVLSAIPTELSLRPMLESLDRISINYNGGKLTEDEQFPFAPSFEALLQYESPQAMERAVSQVQSTFDSLDWREQEVTFGSQVIFFKRTSTKTLYICSDKAQYCPSGNPNLTRCQTGFLCQGDLGRLTSIKNTGWAGLVLDMIPAFRASKELFDGTKEIKSSKEGIEIIFKPGKEVLHELLKTLVVYGQE